jgi:hypothetical protein
VARCSRASAVRNLIKLKAEARNSVLLKLLRFALSDQALSLSSRAAASYCISMEAAVNWLSRRASSIDLGIMSAPP